TTATTTTTASARSAAAEPGAPRGTRQAHGEHRLVTLAARSAIRSRTGGAVTRPIILSLLLAGCPSPEPEEPLPDTSVLADAIDGDALMAHLDALEAIARDS